MRIVALMGKAGAGKDTILRYLCDHYDVHEIVSCTTRPPRQGEVDGVNYFFLSNEEFATKVLNFEMLEATEFNGWFYGTDETSLSANKINLGVFNPAGIDALRENPHIDLTVIMVDATDKERLIRQLNREDNPDVKEIIRRFKTDEEDFAEVEFDYIILNTDNTFPDNTNELASLLLLGKIK